MKNRLYESVSILNGNLKDEEIKETIGQYEKFFQENNLEVDNFEEIGLRKLAYEIKGNKEGYYIVFKFWGDRNDIPDFEKFLRENDNVVKFITVDADQTRGIDENEEDEEEL